MKLTFKDLKQQKFSIEAEPSDSISTVKDKIAAEKEWEADKLKLIYSGKVLQDEKTVEFYKIEEKGYIVCMVAKPKPQPATATVTAAKAPSTPAPPAAVQTPAAPAPAPAPAPAAAAPTTDNVPASPSPAPAAAAAATAGSGAGPAFGSSPQIAMGAQREEAIENLVGMGFPREEVQRALRAAFNNADRAVEYLLNGIPENIQQEQRSTPRAARPPASSGQGQAAASPPPAAAATTTAAIPQTAGDDQPINLFEAAAQAQAGQGGGRSGAHGQRAAAAEAGEAAAPAGGFGNLEFLRNNPQFQQLRQVVQQQPHMLEPILQQVGNGNPQLARLIGQNPEQFLQLLSEDVDDDAPVPPGMATVSVTEEERAAIDRLCSLGFARDDVIQAYFACDKNEELAANFLFEQPDDADDGQ